MKLQTESRAHYTEHNDPHELEPLLCYCAHHDQLNLNQETSQMKLTPKGIWKTQNKKRGWRILNYNHSKLKKKKLLFFPQQQEEKKKRRVNGNLVSFPFWVAKLWFPFQFSRESLRDHVGTFELERCHCCCPWSKLTLHIFFSFSLLLYWMSPLQIFTTQVYKDLITYDALPYYLIYNYFVAIILILNYS